MSRFFSAVILLVTVSGAAADESAVTYSTHIRKIFRDNCANCHNASRARAGLDLSSYAGVIKGSTSGEIVIAGSADDSLLYLTMTHAEEPAMPPGKAPLKDRYLNQVRVWIETGAPETPKDVSAEAVAMAKAKATAQPAMNTDSPVADAADTAAPVGLRQQVYAGQQGNPVTALAVSPDSSVIAVGSQLQILLFDGQSGQFQGSLAYPEGEVFQLTFSDDGSTLAAGGGTAAESGNVVLWSTKSWQRTQVVGDSYDVVYGCDVTADGRLVLYGGPDRILRIADTQSGYITGVIKKHTDWVMAAAFSPEGFIFTTADRDGNAYVFETESRQLLHTLRGHSGAITAIDWSADGNYCFTSSEDGTVRCWNMHTGKAEKQWTAHKPGTLSMSVGPDGTIATTGRDNFVRRWSADGRQLAEYATKAAPTRVAFAKDALVAGDWSGQVQMWMADNEQPLLLTVPAASQTTDSAPFLVEVSGPTAITEIMEPVVEAPAATPATVTPSVGTLPAGMTLPEVPIEQITARLAAAEQSLQNINQKLTSTATASSPADLQAALAAAARIAGNIESPSPEIMEAQVFLKAALQRTQLVKGGSGSLSQQSRGQLREELLATDQDLQAVVAACQQMQSEYQQIEQQMAAMAARSSQLKSQYISVVEQLQKLTGLSTKLKQQLSDSPEADARPASAN